MKKTKNIKRAFTIVELVITIAIVAILAAILIPTFINVAKNARLSADQQSVYDMNLALAVDEAENGAQDNVVDMLNHMDENYNFSNYHTFSKGYGFYWKKSVNRVVLVDTTEYEIVYPEEYVGTVGSAELVNTADELNANSDAEYFSLSLVETVSVKAGSGYITYDSILEAARSQNTSEIFKGEITLYRDLDLSDPEQDDCYTYDIDAFGDGSLIVPGLVEDWRKITIKNDCTLNLRGNTITLRGCIEIDNGANVTINNGTINFELCDEIKSAWSGSIEPVQVINGNLTLNNVTIGDVISSRSISVGDGSSTGSGTLTINGGTIYGVIVLYANANASLNGVTIVCGEGAAFQMNNNTSLEITNSTVSCKYLISAQFKNMSASISITGGEYTIGGAILYGSGKTSENLTLAVSESPKMNGGTFEWTVAS